MISGISKKVILTSLFFINIIQPSKTADLEKISRSDNIETKLTRLKISNFKHSSNTLNGISKGNIDENFFIQKVLNQSEATLAFISE